MIGLYLLGLATLNMGAALIIFFGALGTRLRLYPAWHKVGLILAAFGLVTSSLLYVEIVLDGGPQVSFFKLFLIGLKDVGMCIIGFGYLIRALRGHKTYVE